MTRSLKTFTIHDSNTRIFIDYRHEEHTKVTTHLRNCRAHTSVPQGACEVLLKAGLYIVRQRMLVLDLDLQKCEVTHFSFDQ